MLYEEHGYIGNIWVRQNYLEKAGDTAGGHAHFFDHVSLLAKGSIGVTLNGSDYHEFHAPTFIVIRKNNIHNITALEDDTSWYCVFAARDIYGETQDIVDVRNDPWFANGAPPDFWEKYPMDYVPNKETADSEVEKYWLKEKQTND